MTELERLLSQDDACLVSIASIKRALKQDSKKGEHMQYMKYIAVRDVALEINKELEKGAKVILMVPFLTTDNWGSRTAGYNVLFEKEEEENWKKRIEDEIAKKDEEIKLLKAELNKPITLCDSCTTNGCILQSGIVRNHCDFYKAESEV